MGKFAGDRTIVQLLEQELNAAPPSKKAMKVPALLALSFYLL
jgi:hypothetical protein